MPTLNENSAPQEQGFFGRLFSGIGDVFKAIVDMFAGLFSGGRTDTDSTATDVASSGASARVVTTQYSAASPARTQAGARSNAPAESTQPATVESFFAANAQAGAAPVTPLRVSQISADSPGADRLVEMVNNHVRSFDNNYYYETNPGIQLAGGRMDNVGLPNVTYRMNKAQFEQQQNFNPWGEYSRNIASGMPQDIAYTGAMRQIRENNALLARNDAAMRTLPNQGLSTTPLNMDTFALSRYAMIQRVDNPQITPDRVVQQDEYGNIRINVPSTGRVEIKADNRSAVMPGEEATYTVSIIPVDAIERTGSASFKPIIVEGVTRDQLENRLAFVTPERGPNMPGARKITISAPTSENLALNVFSEGAQISNRGAVANVNGAVQRDVNEVESETRQARAAQELAARQQRIQEYRQGERDRHGWQQERLDMLIQRRGKYNELYEKDAQSEEISRRIRESQRADAGSSNRSNGRYAMSDVGENTAVNSGITFGNAGTQRTV